MKIIFICTIISAVCGKIMLEIDDLDEIKVKAANFDPSYDSFGSNNDQFDFWDWVDNYVANRTPRPVPTTTVAQDDTKYCSDCGKGNPNSPVRPDHPDSGFQSIVGGSSANPNSLVWQAQLLVDRTSLCGGTLISCDWILSAAHCFTKKSLRNPSQSVDIRLGANKLLESNSAVVKCDAKKVILGKQWGKNRRNPMLDDIALINIECQDDITAYDNIAPACLPPAELNLKNATGETVLVSGWGTTASDGDVSTNLQQVYLKTIPRDVCATKYIIDKIPISPNMMCAGAVNKDSCQGDSGGPLVQYIDGKYTVVGVVSFGVGCADEKYPGVYTHVADYLNFIRNVTGL